MRPSAVTAARWAAALGPFFAFDIHDPHSPLTGPWRSMGELVREPGVLPERVASVRRHLAAAGGRPPEAVEARVAASVTHLGLVARLVSPALALAAFHGTFPALALDEVRWQPVLGGAFPLSLPRPACDGTAGAGAEAVPGGAVGDLLHAVAELSVSPRVLWGNVASAVNGAVAAAGASASPHAARLRPAAARVLALPPLRDAHTTAPVTGRFKRRSCCLIYRAAPNAAGALCGDCVLAG